MPEIANRNQVDTLATTRLSALFSRQGQRLVGFGDRTPSSGAAAPPGEWQRQEDELAALLLLLMDDVFQAGASSVLDVGRQQQLSAPSESTLRHASREYARRMATDLAKQGTANTRQYLADGGTLDVAFGRDRAESLAVTEITRARVAGERAVIDEIEKRGAVVLTFWRTEQDAKVCPICRPLDGADQYRWEQDFPAGPPAHPRCRCELEYQVQGASA